MTFRTFLAATLVLGTMLTALPIHSHAAPANRASLTLTPLPGDTPDTPARLPGDFAIDYPEALKTHGNIGAVQVTLKVSADGRVSDVVVQFSHHPALEAAVIDALLAARLDPARRHGQPVDSTAQLRVNFRLAQPPGRGYASDGVVPYVLPRNSLAALPDTLRYDEPPTPVLTTQAVYPLALAREGVEGTARVAFLVDKTGRVIQTRVLDADQAAFGEAVAAMLESWKFTPAKRDCQPTDALLVKDHRFGAKSRDTALTDADRTLLSGLASGSVAPTELAGLDRMPAMRYSVAPVYPTELRRQHQNGRAVIEFMLAPSGRVHLPRVVNATHPEFGWSAATALLRARFDTPTRQGQPVVARLQLPFEFTTQPMRALP